LHRRSDAGPGGAEPWMVPVGEGAALDVRRELAAQPLFLRRAGAHGDVAVQHHDVPGAEIVAVVALPGVARRAAEIREIAARARGQVVFVTRRRARPRPLPPPRRPVTV